MTKPIDPALRAAARAAVENRDAAELLPFFRSNQRPLTAKETQLLRDVAQILSTPPDTIKFEFEDGDPPSDLERARRQALGFKARIRQALGKGARKVTVDGEKRSINEYCADCACKLLELEGKTKGKTITINKKRLLALIA
jgi:hypothetical protein